MSKSKEEFNERREYLQNLSNCIDVLSSSVSLKNGVIASYKRSVATYEDIITTKDRTIKTMEERIAIKEQHIKELETKLKQ